MSDLRTAVDELKEKTIASLELFKEEHGSLAAELKDGAAAWRNRFSGSETGVKHHSAGNDRHADPAPRRAKKQAAPGKGKRH